MAQWRGHDALSEATAKRLLAAPWRVGKKVPRNIYALTREVKHVDDSVIFGQVDSSWLAEHIVDLHNAWLQHNDGEDRAS